MLQLNLRTKLLTSGIATPHTWLKNNLRCSKSKAHNLLHGKVKSIHPKDLTIICMRLNCAPHELFCWNKKSKVKLPKEHLLRELYVNKVSA